MQLELNGKTVIVTGGAKGIGEAITRVFAEEGAVPVIFGRNVDEASALASELEGNGCEVLSEHVEMTDLIGLKAAVGRVLEKRGGVDVVVNNAAAK